MKNIVDKLIKKEEKRQNRSLELIASENYPSKAVRRAVGSIMMDKYAEGYPGKRYYGGCAIIDEVEQLAIDLVCKNFGCKYANVQPHSGSQANYAAFHALLPHGGKILSLGLNDGGHLSHGTKMSFSGNDYEIVNYHLDKSGHIDMQNVKELALKELPDIILCGYSAYPYLIPFQAFRGIVDQVNKVFRNHICGSAGDSQAMAAPALPERHCYLVADIAHVAGLVLAGVHPSPFPWCDVVTTTTHKTLRGPRGGMIMWNDEGLGRRINSSVFPYAQGGPLENNVAGKAVMMLEGETEEFKEYGRQVVRNTKVLSDTLRREGCKVSGSENHLLLINCVESWGMCGAEVEKRLEKVGIYVNKNMLPGDKLGPNKCEGIRVGMAALTTREIKEKDVVTLGWVINRYLRGEVKEREARKFLRFRLRRV